MNEFNKRKVYKIITRAESSSIFIDKLGKYNEDELLDELLTKYNRKTIVSSLPLFTKSENKEKIARYFIEYPSSEYIYKLLCNESFISNISKETLNILLETYFNCCLDIFDASLFVTLPVLYELGFIDNKYIENKLNSSEHMKVKFMYMLINQNYVNKNILSYDYMENVVLKSNDIHLIYLFSKYCINANIDKLQQKIIESNDIKYIYLFLKDVNCANKKPLLDKIIESNDKYYLICTIANIDISLIDQFNSAKDFLNTVLHLNINESEKMILVNKIMSELEDNEIKEESNKKVLKK